VGDDRPNLGPQDLGLLPLPQVGPKRADTMAPTSAYVLRRRSSAVTPAGWHVERTMSPRVSPAVLSGWYAIAVIPTRLSASP
jgi:hypothetical protein